MEARRKGMEGDKGGKACAGNFFAEGAGAQPGSFCKHANDEENEDEVPRWKKKNGGQGPPLGALAEEGGAPRYGMRSWRPMTRLLSSPRTSRLATRISAQRPGVP